jgi:hypothetical protein
MGTNHMIMLAICSMLIGSTLAIRFRLIVPLPMIFLGSAVLTTISAIQNGPLLQTVLTVTVFATSLQLGYVFAALMKYRVIPLPSQTYAIAATENPEASVRLSSLGPKSCAQVLDPSLVPKSRIQIIRLALVTAASRSAPRAAALTST